MTPPPAAQQHQPRSAAAGAAGSPPTSRSRRFPLGRQPGDLRAEALFAVPSSYAFGRDAQDAQAGPAPASGSAAAASTPGAAALAVTVGPAAQLTLSAGSPRASVLKTADSPRRRAAAAGRPVMFQLDGDGGAPAGAGGGAGAYVMAAPPPPAPALGPRSVPASAPQPAPLAPSQLPPPPSAPQPPAYDADEPAAATASAMGLAAGRLLQLDSLAADHATRSLRMHLQLALVGGDAAPPGGPSASAAAAAGAATSGLDLSGPLRSSLRPQAQGQHAAASPAPAAGRSPAPAGARRRSVTGALEGAAAPSAALQQAPEDALPLLRRDFARALVGAVAASRAGASPAAARAGGGGASHSHSPGGGERGGGQAEGGFEGEGEEDALQQQLAGSVRLLCETRDALHAVVARGLYAAAQALSERVQAAARAPPADKVSAREAAEAVERATTFGGARSPPPRPADPAAAAAKAAHSRAGSVLALLQELRAGALGQLFAAAHGPLGDAVRLLARCRAAIALLQAQAGELDDAASARLEHELSSVFSASLPRLLPRAGDAAAAGDGAAAAPGGGGGGPSKRESIGWDRRASLGVGHFPGLTAASGGAAPQRLGNATAGAAAGRRGSVLSSVFGGRRSALGFGGRSVRDGWPSVGELAVEDALLVQGYVSRLWDQARFEAAEAGQEGGGEQAGGGAGGAGEAGLDYGLLGGGEGGLGRRGSLGLASPFATRGGAPSAVFSATGASGPASGRGGAPAATAASAPAASTASLSAGWQRGTSPPPAMRGRSGSTASAGSGVDDPLAAMPRYASSGRFPPFNPTQPQPLPELGLAADAAEFLRFPRAFQALASAPIPACGAAGASGGGGLHEGGRGSDDDSSSAGASETAHAARAAAAAELLVGLLSTGGNADAGAAAGVAETCGWLLWRHVLVRVQWHLRQRAKAPPLGAGARDVWTFLVQPELLQAQPRARRASASARRPSVSAASVLGEGTSGSGSAGVGGGAAEVLGGYDCELHGDSEGRRTLDLHAAICLYRALEAAALTHVWPMA